MKINKTTGHFEELSTADVIELGQELYASNSTRCPRKGESRFFDFYCQEMECASISYIAKQYPIRAALSILTVYAYGVEKAVTLLNPTTHRG